METRGASNVYRTVLRPRVGWQKIDFAELWHYRELLWILALRDIKVRYKQTILGGAWAIIQPLAQMIVFVAFFAGYAPQGVPKSLFFFCGLLPWQLFTTAIGNAGNSLVGNQNLITKVYFPRLAIPIASVVTSVVDFAIAFGLFIIMMAFERFPPYHMAFLFPVFVLMAFLAALAIGLWLSALNVEYRDVRYIIPFIISFAIFVSGVIVPASQLKHQWERILLGINPMAGVVDGFRWCILGTELHLLMLVTSAITIIVLLVGGLLYFRRMEKGFADLI